MRKRFFSLLFFLLLLIVSGFFIQRIRNLSSPFRIEPDPETVKPMQETHSYTDLFAVRRGSIQDVFPFEETLPNGSCIPITLSLPQGTGRLYAAPGDFLSPGQTVWKYTDGRKAAFSFHTRILSTLQDQRSSKIRIRFLPSRNILLKLLLPEAYMNRICSGTRVQVQIGSDPVEVSPVAIGCTITNGTFPFFLALHDEQILARNGCHITGTILLEEKENVLLIPNNCLFTDNASNPYVLVQEGEDLFETPVETGIRDDTMTEILSGLSEGQFVASAE